MEHCPMTSYYLNSMVSNKTENFPWCISFLNDKCKSLQYIIRANKNTYNIMSTVYYLFVIPL